jgi:purine-binding chemotaxis protein CheW
METDKNLEGFARGEDVGKTRADAALTAPSLGLGSVATAGPEAREITSDEKRLILRERAKRLARTDETQRGDEACIEVIEFLLAHERYAVEVNYVREVYPLKDLTPVPCTPSFAVGIVNVRWQVISVLDVREFFDLPTTAVTDLFRVIILRDHKIEFGILADSVIGERRVPLNEIQLGIPGLKGIREEYVRGITRDRLIIMNAEKLLSDESLIVHQEAGD